MTKYNDTSQLLDVYQNNIVKNGNNINTWIKICNKMTQSYDKFVDLLFNFICRCIKYNDLYLFNLLYKNICSRNISDIFTYKHLHILSKKICKYFYIYKDIRILQHFLASGIFNEKYFELITKWVIIYLKNKKSKSYKIVKKELVNYNDYWSNSYDNYRKYAYAIESKKNPTGSMIKYNKLKNNIIKIIFKCIKYNDHNSLKKIFTQLRSNKDETIIHQLKSMQYKLLFYKKIAKYAFIYRNNINEFKKIHGIISDEIFTFNNII